MYLSTLECNTSGSRQEIFRKKTALQNFVKFLWSRFFKASALQDRTQDTISKLEYPAIISPVLCVQLPPLSRF